MEIKKNPAPNARANPIKKEERKEPKRSFKEVMSKEEEEKSESVFALASKSELAEKSESIFDLASKGEMIEGGQVFSEYQGGVTVEESSFTPEVHALSPGMRTLVEEMANYVLIESDNGISTTTVEVGKEGSVFDGTIVEVEHYDTDPHSFNLRMMGSPENLEMFSANLKTLERALKAHETLKGFHVRLLTPVIGEKSDLHERSWDKNRREKESKKVQSLSSQKKMTS